MLNQLTVVISIVMDVCLNVYLNSIVKICGCFDVVINLLSDKLFCALYL